MHSLTAKSSGRHSIIRMHSKDFALANSFSSLSEEVIGNSSTRRAFFQASNFRLPSVFPFLLATLRNSCARGKESTVNCSNTSFRKAKHSLVPKSLVRSCARFVSKRCLNGDLWRPSETEGMEFSCELSV